MAIVSTVMPLLYPVEQTFKLLDRSLTSRNGIGQTIVKKRWPGLWMASWSTRELRHDVAIDLEAVINSLDGGVHGFYAYDARRPYPLMYPGGIYPGGFSGTCKIHTVGVDNKSFRLKNLPVGFTLKRGDYLAFNYGTEVARALHQIMSETTVADGSGITPSFEVRPFIRPGAAADIDVYLSKPSAAFKMTPDTFDPTAGLITTTASIEAYQFIAVPEA